MNIMFVSSDNNATSGAFLSMARLAAILKEKHRHNILVILPYEGDGKLLLDELHIESRLIRSYAWTVKITDVYQKTRAMKQVVKQGVTRRAANKISKVIRDERIDIVHLNTSWGYVGALATIKTNTPFVWHIREFLEEDQGMQIWHREKGYELMKKADCLVAISKSIEKKYVSIFGEEKLKVILNGISPEEYYCPEHELFTGSVVEMLMVGGLCEGKGQHLAISACALLRKRGFGQFRLRLVGRGSEEYLKSLKRQVVEKNLSGRIEFCGPSLDTPSYYKTSDIMLVCSRVEAFGRVTVEAMFAGALLIGSDSAGTAELVEHGVTGLLYGNGNASALADQIAYAVTHKAEVKAMARRGQLYMMENMTADQNAESVNKLYLEILRGGAEEIRVSLLVFAISDLTVSASSERRCVA